MRRRRTAARQRHDVLDLKQVIEDRLMCQTLLAAVSRSCCDDVAQLMRHRPKRPVPRQYPVLFQREDVLACQGLPPACPLQHQASVLVPAQVSRIVKKLGVSLPKYPFQPLGDFDQLRLGRFDGCASRLAVGRGLSEVVVIEVPTSGEARLLDAIDVVFTHIRGQEEHAVRRIARPATRLVAARPDRGSRCASRSRSAARR